MDWEKDETLVDGREEEENLTDGQEEDLFQMLGMEKEGDESLKAAKRMAEKGEVPAMLSLGSRYMEGRGVEQDFAESCYWYEKSNDAAGFFRIGFQYEQEGELELAKDYYVRAAKAESDYFGTDCVQACIKLAVLYLKEEPEMASTYLAEAVETGIPADLEETICQLSGVLGRQLASENKTEGAIRWLSYALKGGKNQEISNLLLRLCREGMEADPETSLWKTASSALEKLTGHGEKLASGKNTDPSGDRIIGPDEGSKMIAELKKQRSIVLVIPDGVTCIANEAFSPRCSYDSHMKYVKKIEKIVIPDSVERIGRRAFDLFASLKEIRLPANLKWLGAGFADNNYTNFLNILCRDKRIFDKIEIPAGTTLEKEVFDGIGRIETLVFRDGREAIDWNFLTPQNSIGKIIVPQSVKSMVPFDYCYDNCKIRIDCVVLPERLREQFEGCVKQKYLISKIHIEYYA